MPFLNSLVAQVTFPVVGVVPNESCVLAKCLHNGVKFVFSNRLRGIARRIVSDGTPIKWSLCCNQRHVQTEHHSSSSGLQKDSGPFVEPSSDVSRLASFTTLANKANTFVIHDNQLFGLFSYVHLHNEGRTFYNRTKILCLEGPVLYLGSIFPFPKECLPFLVLLSVLASEKTQLLYSYALSSLHRGFYEESQTLVISRKKKKRDFGTKKFPSDASEWQI